MGMAGDWPSISAKNPLVLLVERFVNAERGWNLSEFAKPPRPLDAGLHFPLVYTWWGAYAPLSC